MAEPKVGDRVRYTLRSGRQGEGVVSGVTPEFIWPYEVKNLTPENVGIFLADGTGDFAADELEIIE